MIVEIWESSTQNGTYTFLDEFPAKAEDQEYVYTPVTPTTTKWFKARYRTKNGFHSDFNTAKKGTTSTVFDTSVPTNDPSPSTLTTPTLQNDGSAVIVLDWATYSQGANEATGLIVFWKSGTSAPGSLATTDHSMKLALTSTSYKFQGLAADLHYRFGIAAYKATRHGMAVGTIVDHSTWQDVQPTARATIKDMDVDGILQNKGILIFE